MTGKGSSPRPKSVSDEEFGKRFDAIDWSDARVPARVLVLGEKCLYAAPFEGFVVDEGEIEGRPISGDEPLDYPQPGTPIWSER